jgi:predicted nucleotidyltransferase
MRTADDLPLDVSTLLDAFVAGVREALADNLLGVYLRGSLAIGDFDPETSDVDVLAVTRRRVSDGEFEALREMHDRLRALPNRYAAGLEVAYINAAAAKKFKTGQRHPNITSHDPFRWERLESNYVLDLWMAGEQSCALYGFDPRAVFGPITADELRAAAFQRLREWARWAAAVPDEDAEWLNERGHQAYVVETICRALLTAESGGVPTKRRAVEWACRTLPEEWRGLVEWSQQHRVDDAMDETMVPEVVRFIEWASAKPDPGRLPAGH